MNIARGFTLVELMVTILIIAVLAAFAAPQYQEYVAKGKRSAALTSLLEASHQLERYYSANGTYLGAGGDLANVYTSTVGSAVGGDYVIADSAANPATQNTFTLQATRSGSMLSDRCGDIQVDQAGNQSVVNFSGFADTAAAVAYCLRQ